MKKLNSLIFAVVLVSSTAFAQHPPVNGAAMNKPAALDGNWWAKATPENRAGALDGVQACLVYDKKVNLKPMSNAELTKAVESYFAVRKNRSHLIIEAIPGVPKAAADMHTGADPHGMGATKKATPKVTTTLPAFDAAYWNAGSNDQRMGFVLGYTTCKWSLRPDPEWSTNIRENVTKNYQANPKSTEKLTDLIVRIAKARKHMT